jgi:hypothetical protein
LTATARVPSLGGTQQQIGIGGSKGGVREPIKFSEGDLHCDYGLITKLTSSISEFGYCLLVLVLSKIKYGKFIIRFKKWGA